MKVAVSIPDDVYQQAERLAASLRTSRSGLYARALEEFIERSDTDSVTDSMNSVIDEIGDAPDPFIGEAARQVLRRVEW